MTHRVDRPAPWPELQAVLFDLDGTLIDSAPDLGQAGNEVRASLGLPPLPLALYRPVAGAGARGILGVALGVTPNDPRFERLREVFFSAYERQLTAQTRVFEGVAGMLEQLMACGLRWGVVTNKSQRFTTVLVERLPLFARASVVISGDTTAFSKPHPEPIFEACRRLNLAPAQCVYVGDDLRDIQAGQAAGMRTLAVQYGYLGTDADPTLWGADCCMDHPSEVSDCLLDWKKLCHSALISP